jgi:subtilase family serine protease
MFSFTRFIPPTAILISLLISPAWSQEGRVVIRGNTPPSLERATFVKRSDPNSAMEIVVGLKMRNQPDLADLIARQQDSASPDYQRFITPADFAGTFAPAQEDVDNIVRYLESQELSVLQVTPNRMLIQARGPVAQVEEAFSVKINIYSLMGEEKFSSDRDPRVPRELRGIVSAVIGLSSLTKPHSFAWGGQPSTTTAVSYTPLQTATAYNLPNKNNQHPPKSVYSGKGVQIGIATFGTYMRSDLTFYLKYYGITRSGTIRVIPVGGSTKQVNYESTLDIQEVAAQATGANISVYEVPADTFADFTTMYSRIVTDNIASVVSSSWVACEADTGPAVMAAEDALFMQGVAQGITFFVGSGDNGAYACSASNTTLAVDYPSIDPYITAVGGTSLYLNSTGGYKSEKAWQFSGGGVSSIFTRPSWQTGPGEPLTTDRGLADVSWDADGNTGQYTYFQGNWYIGFGTSYGGPNWAALWALATQALSGKRTGQAAPLLYKLGASTVYHANLHDVTTGNNGAGVGPGYKAGKNWDYPTGWGTPNGANLVKWLIANP